jgi:ATP-dependent RNA helicase DHX37/DHR1
VGWISKASAAQRAGRAGRTGPGHCYRLYSSAVYEHHFKSFSQPEILRMPIEGVVLLMKSMHIDAVVNFPFPTPPDRLTLKKAETVLSYLGALGVPATLTQQGKHGVEVVDNATIGGHITDLGRVMSLFPLSPRFSRMLVSGRKEGCLPFVVSIVSALSVGELFLREDALEGDSDVMEDGDAQALSHLNSEAVKVKEARKKQRKNFFRAHQVDALLIFQGQLDLCCTQTHSSLGDFTSDVFKVLSVVGAYEYAGGGHKFCEDNFVRPKVCVLSS